MSEQPYLVLITVDRQTFTESGTWQPVAGPLRTYTAAEVDAMDRVIVVQKTGEAPDNEPMGAEFEFPILDDIGADLDLDRPGDLTWDFGALRGAEPWRD